MLDQVDDRMFLPYFLIFTFFAQPFTHIPVIGERTDIDTAACASGCTENILMTEREPHGAVASHAQTGDGACRAVFYCRVVGVDIIDQLLSDKSFIAVRRIDRTVPIPAVLAIRTNKYDSILVSDFG